MMDQSTLDNTTATRIIHYLITPFTQWEAFRIGIIDKNGNEVRGPRPDEEKFFNLLHRLCLKIRKMLQTAPGANKLFPASMAGQFFLGQKIPAAVLTSWNPANKSVTPALISVYSTVRESYLKGALDIDCLLEYNSEMQQQFDEEIGNAIANVAGVAPGDEPPGKKNTKNILRRGTPKITFKKWIEDEYGVK